jgi:hypothetical protein
MKKQIKINLEKLNIQSFITTLNELEIFTIVGGIGQINGTVIAAVRTSYDDTCPQSNGGGYCNTPVHGSCPKQAVAIETIAV